MIPNKLYDVLKWFAILGANAISGFLVYCGQALNNNAITIAAGIVSALGVCIGGCLGISSINYNKAKEEANEKFFTNTVEFLEDINNEQHSE